MISKLSCNRIVDPDRPFVLATVAIVVLIAEGALAAVVPDIPLFEANLRILFQGDSFTDGNRNDDPNHILGHGSCFIIAAKYGAQYPERKLRFINRGISGDKVTDLAACTVQKLGCPRGVRGSSFLFPSGPCDGEWASR